MPRPVTPAARRAMFAPQTGEAVLILLTLSHPSLADPIRLVNDGRNWISRGQLYQRCPFEIDWPEETDGAPSPIKFRIANAHRDIVIAVRQLTGEQLKATAELVLASDPDSVFAGPVEFTMPSASYTAEVVEADLRFEDVLNEPFPADTFSPSTTPGLF